MRFSVKINFICRATGLSSSLELFQFGLMLWSCFLFAEYQTIALLLVVESGFTAAVVSSYLTIIYLILGSGYLRWANVKFHKVLSTVYKFRSLNYHVKRTLDTTTRSLTCKCNITYRNIAFTWRCSVFIRNTKENFQ